MGIVKATTSDHMIDIMQNINPINQMLQPLQDHTTTSTADDAGVMVTDLHV
jgi:hypothetical protein